MTQMLNHVLTRHYKMLAILVIWYFTQAMDTKHAYTETSHMCVRCKVRIERQHSWISIGWLVHLTVKIYVCDLIRYILLFEFLYSTLKRFL